MEIRSGIPSQVNSAFLKQLGQSAASSPADATKGSSFSPQVDEVSFSAEAMQAQDINATQQPQDAAAMRMARLEQIQTDIANGTYDVNGLIEPALSRMIDQIRDTEM
jgi:anti-sigma28 factor (negative regulator of flagellin synthesis)